VFLQGKLLCKTAVHSVTLRGVGGSEVAETNTSLQVTLAASASSPRFDIMIFQASL
jgi:hypothetical protein